MVDELPGYDAWLTNPDANEKEPAIVEQCCSCKCDLYEGEECYYIGNEYYCEYCVGKSKVFLDEIEPDWGDED